MTIALWLARALPQRGQGMPDCRSIRRAKGMSENTPDMAVAYNEVGNLWPGSHADDSPQHEGAYRVRALTSRLLAAAESSGFSPALEMQTDERALECHGHRHQNADQ